MKNNKYFKLTKNYINDLKEMVKSEYCIICGEAKSPFAI